MSANSCSPEISVEGPPIPRLRSGQAQNLASNEILSDERSEESKDFSLSGARKHSGPATHSTGLRVSWEKHSSRGLGRPECSRRTRPTASRDFFTNHWTFPNTTMIHSSTRRSGAPRGVKGKARCRSTYRRTGSGRPGRNRRGGTGPDGGALARPRFWLHLFRTEKGGKNITSATLSFINAFAPFPHFHYSIPALDAKCSMLSIRRSAASFRASNK